MRLRYCPIETGREVVEYHDALARVDERMNHVTSDIAGATGDQDRHTGGLSTNNSTREPCASISADGREAEARLRISRAIPSRARPISSYGRRVESAVAVA